MMVRFLLLFFTSCTGFGVISSFWKGLQYRTRWWILQLGTSRLQHLSNNCWSFSSSVAVHLCSNFGRTWSHHKNSSILKVTPVCVSLLTLQHPVSYLLNNKRLVTWEFVNSLFLERTCHWTTEHRKCSVVRPSYLWDISSPLSPL